MTHRELFQPTIEGEARLLLLIDSFSTGRRILEGRTKLAKLDFFLRYPSFMRKGLKIRSMSKSVPDRDIISLDIEMGEDNVENRMVRYRYGPWDPMYYTLLGRLIGRGLVEPYSFGRGIGFKTTEKGTEVAKQLANESVWAHIALKCKILRRHFDLTGTSLKEFIYEHFPEVTQSDWGEVI